MKALIVGGGGLRAGDGHGVAAGGHRRRRCSRHVGRAAEAGSYLTVATNGLDALRAIDAHGPVLAAGFPTPWTIMASGTGKRLRPSSRLVRNLPGP